MAEQSDSSGIKGMIAGFTGGRLLAILVGAASVCIILFSVQNMAGLITPVMIAFLMAVSLSPVIGYFERRGLSRTLAFVALIAIILGIFLALGLLLTSSLNRLIDKIPEYAANLDARSAETEQAVAAYGVDVEGMIPDDVADAANQQATQNMLRSLATSLAALLGTTFWIFLLFIFLLGDLIDLPKRVSSGLEVDPGILPRIDQVRSNVTTYFTIRTQVGIFTGAFNTIVCLLLGVDFALLWGLLAFITNYLPSFGFIISAIPPIIFAWLEFGIERAIVVAILLLGVNTVVDQLISPRLTSRGMSLPISVVLLSMTFWGWLLGPVGAFLAAPLTIILKLTLDAFPEARNLTSLITMGGEEGETGPKAAKIRIPLPGFLRRKPQAENAEPPAPPATPVESPAPDAAPYSK